MEKFAIGTNAGIIWNALNQMEEVSIPELAQEIGLSFEDAILAVGWLARENKICLVKRDNMMYVFKEKHFDFCFG